MASHTASIVVHAPVCDVYQSWMRLYHYPLCMSNVRNLSYIDYESTRWIANVVGSHGWMARNENWIPNRQIGWRSIEGPQNSGLVEFSSKPNSDTQVNVVVEYLLRAGHFGRLIEALGAGKAFERRLRRNLERFAQEIDKQGKSAALDRRFADARMREGRGDTLAQDARNVSTLAEAISSAEPFEAL
ncbi:MAG: SRPBCC family protein [Vulcanimicrobiaceae bacterium]